MSEWVVKNLDEVVEYFIDYRGKTPVKTGSGIPLITAKIVKDGCLQTPTEFISVEDYPLWMTRGYPEVNDVVLTTEAPLGEVALIKNKNVALAQRIITLRGYKNILDNKFLKYWLQSEQGQYELESRASGTTVFGIKSSILKKIPISLPPYNEQVAISSVLYSIDEKIDLLHRQNKTLESMAETLFRQWFILDSTGVSVSIDQIIDFNPKRTLIKSQDATYLDMAGLSTVIFRANGYYRRPFSSGTKFTKRDTLLARITPCLENGKAAYIDFLDDNETGWGSTEFIVMRPKKEIHPFISYIMCRNPDFKEYAESCMEGSTGRQRVNLDHLKKFNVNLPTEASLRIINELLDSFESKLINNSKQIDSLEKLRDTFFPN